MMDQPEQPFLLAYAMYYGILRTSSVVLVYKVRTVKSLSCFSPLVSSIYFGPGDCMKLWKDYQVNTRNCIDLALLARTVDNARWKGRYRDPIGLSRLCETYEELSLEKGRITRSNWEAVLSGPQKQCEYQILLLNGEVDRI